MDCLLLTTVTERELSELAEIEQDCFSVPLEREQIRSLLKNERTHWFAVREGEKLLGSLWMQTVLDEGDIGNVAVRGDARRRGAADLLLWEAERWAEANGLSFLTLEVRAGNAPAIALYEKHHFCRVGLRPGYYTGPREDAVIMTRTF